MHGKDLLAKVEAIPVLVHPVGILSLQITPHSILGTPAELKNPGLVTELHQSPSGCC